MATKEELWPLFKKALEESATRTPPKAPINKDNTVAAIVRRWFERQKRTPEDLAKTQTRIKELTSKIEKTQEIAREGVRGELFLTKQPEFSPHMTSAVMEKVLDKVPQPLPTWMPTRAELNSNPFLAEGAARIALLPDPEDPAALYEQLTIMYRSANFSKMTDGEIREFRNFADKTKQEVFRLAADPNKKFKASSVDDIESPWRKKVDIYRSRRLGEQDPNPTNDVIINARNTRRKNFDTFLKDIQEQLEVEDPKKEGKALIELRKKIEDHIVPDDHGSTFVQNGRRRENVFNRTEAGEYIELINKRLDTIGSEDRWSPIEQEQAHAAGPAGTGGRRGTFKELFVVEQEVVSRLTPEVRAYYEHVLDYLENAPDGEIKRGTLEQFVQQLEMLSRSKEPGAGRNPDSDAAIKQLLEGVEAKMNSGRLEIPTSIYLSEDEVRGILEDFVGWAEDYMREIERLISIGGTDNPALRPIMDRFHLAQEFYGGKFFQRNLIDPNMPKADIDRLEAFFAKNYEDRVYVMDQYRVRLLHAEIENQLEFVRDWDVNKQDIQRVNEMAKQLGDLGIFAGRGYQGGMVDVVASNYLLPTLGEKVFSSETRETQRWTKQLAEETLRATVTNFEQDAPLYNEQYKKHMMDLRWRAKGKAYVDADLGVENTYRTNGNVIPAPHHSIEEWKRAVFEQIVSEKLSKGELRFGSLDDADKDSTIKSIVRSAYSSARLQFQVKEALAMSKSPRDAAIETGYSAFVFAGWEERLQKGDYFIKSHKMRWGMEPHEKAMWRQGNEYLMHKDPEIKRYAHQEANREWGAFNGWWADFHGTLPRNATWNQVESQLKAFKASANPVEKALYDRYVHFVERFLGYPRPDEIGSPIGPNQKMTYEFFRELRSDKLIGKRKFLRQVASDTVTPWQEDHLTRGYNYWKSGERTTAYKDELRAIFKNKGWDESDVDKYYFRGRTLFGKAREYFMPNQHARSEHSYVELRDEIRDVQARYHPLQFVQLEQRVEGSAAYNANEFKEAERRFHMIQGLIISKTKEDIRYRPIDYLNPTDFQRNLVHQVFDTVHINGFTMTEQQYWEVMTRYAHHVEANANGFTDLKYATLLGREILYYDDQPQAIINPEHVETASKGASNLYSRALIDEVKSLQMADVTQNTFTTDLKILDEESEKLRIEVQGYQGEQDAAVAKALALARYVGYTRGRVDFADGLFRNNWVVSEAQEIGKYPGAPSNTAIELEHALGQMQRTERLENWSPAFGESLDSFAGLSNWNKVTGGEKGLLAKAIGERRYQRVMRYMNDRIPSKVALIRFGNLALYFSVFTLGLFIVQQVESGGEDKKK